MERDLSEFRKKLSEREITHLKEPEIQKIERVNDALERSESAEAKKDSKKKKFFFLDIKELKKNLPFVLPVIIIAALLPYSFLTFADFANHFLDAPTRSPIFLIFLYPILFIYFPVFFFTLFMVDYLSVFRKKRWILQLVVLPGILSFLLYWPLDRYAFFPQFQPPVFWIAYFLWFIIYLISLQYLPLKNFNYRGAYVLIACLALFVVGMLVAFSSVFDAQTTLGFSLNKCDTNDKIPDAHFICEGLRKEMFVGEKANCTIQGLEHDNLTTELNFTHFNGSRSGYSYAPGDSISFIVPPDIARVHVNVQSAEPRNEYCVSSAYNTTFTTYANFRQQQKELGFYFVAIISFILISVPTLVDRWIDLFNKRGKP